MATDKTLHQRVWTLWSEADGSADAAERALERARATIADGDGRDLAEELASELEGFPPEVIAAVTRIVATEITDERRLHAIAAEARRLRRVADALWSAVQVSLGKLPATSVVQLREAAAILGVDVRAAESALRRAEVRSGYPLDRVEWLRDNRPGRGARTDLRTA